MVTVSKETAKLAKEIGFDNPCSWYINETGLELNDLGIQQGIPDTDFNQNKEIALYSVPFQFDLQDYLRDKHKINIVINPILVGDDTICHFISIHDSKNREITNWQTHYNNILGMAYQDVEGDYVNDELHDKFVIEKGFAYKKYEQALEVALFKVLSILRCGVIIKYKEVWEK